MNDAIVTPEMIAAGRTVIEQGPITDVGDMSDLYCAMDAHRPVPLVSEAEDRIARLEELLASTKKALVDHYWWLSEARETIVAKDARIAELDTMLAQRPEPVPDTTRAAHDFTRDFNGDRRRIGR